MGKVIKEGFKLSLISYTGAAIGYVNKILLFTNILTAPQLGLIGILVNVAGMFAQGAGMGTPLVIGRFLPFLKTTDNRNNGMLFWVLAFSFAGFLLCSGGLLLFKEQILLRYSESPMLREYFLYLIPVILSTVLFNIFDMYLRMYGKNIFTGFVQDILLRLSGSVSIVLYATGLIDFHNFVGLYIFFQCTPALLLIGYMYYHNLFKLHPVRNAFNNKLYRIAMPYGFFSLLNGFSNHALTTIDKLMLISFSGVIGLTQSAIYDTAYNMVSFMLVPYRAIMRIVQPDVSNYCKTKNRKELQKIYRQTSLILLIIALYLFTVIWINLDSLYNVMPDQYRLGKPVFFLLGLGQIITFYTGINGLILINSKKYLFDMVSNVLLIGLAICTNYIFIPLYGLSGAALATAITTLFFNAVRTFTVWHFFRIHPFAWSDIWFFVLVGACIYLSGLIPVNIHWIVDVILRSMVFTLLFGIPVYFSGVSPEINSVVDRVIIKVLKYGKKE